MKKEQDLSGCIGLLFSGIVLILVMAVVKGAVLRVLWGWFIVPPFGLPELTLAQAYGFALVWAYLSPREASDSEATKELGPMERIVFSFAKVLLEAVVVLGMGWIVTQFLP